MTFIIPPWVSGRTYYYIHTSANNQYCLNSSSWNILVSSTNPVSSLTHWFLLGITFAIGYKNHIPLFEHMSDMQNECWFMFISFGHSILGCMNNICLFQIQVIFQWSEYILQMNICADWFLLPYAGLTLNKYLLIRENNCLTKLSIINEWVSEQIIVLINIAPHEHILSNNICN